MSVNNDYGLKIRHHLPKAVATLGIIAGLVACVLFSMAAADQRILGGEASWGAKYRFDTYTDAGALYIAGAVSSILVATLVLLPYLIQSFDRDDESHLVELPYYKRVEDLTAGQKLADRALKVLVGAGLVTLFTACIIMAIKGGQDVYLESGFEHWPGCAHPFTQVSYTDGGVANVWGSALTGIGGVVGAIFVPCLFGVRTERMYRTGSLTREERESLHTKTGPEMYELLVHRYHDYYTNKYEEVGYYGARVALNAYCSGEQIAFVDGIFSKVFELKRQRARLWPPTKPEGFQAKAFGEFVEKRTVFTATQEAARAQHAKEALAHGESEKMRREASEREHSQYATDLAAYNTKVAGIDQEIETLYAKWNAEKGAQLAPEVSLSSGLKYTKEEPKS